MTESNLTLAAKSMLVEHVHFVEKTADALCAGSSFEKVYMVLEHRTRCEKGSRPDPNCRQFANKCFAK